MALDHDMPAPYVPAVMDPLTIAKELIAAIERGDRAALDRLLAGDVVQTELPNQLLPEGAVRDKKAILDAFERGAALMKTQRYEITGAVAQGDRAAVEVDWRAETTAGKAFRARFAFFFEVKDGKVVAQRNYDCFDPF